MQKINFTTLTTRNIYKISVVFFQTTYRRKKVEFWFATGGAGLCISSALANKMKPWCG